ncbi:MAG TPA: 3'(2'),5'-bisphosphate nucleotidase CysQ, partial [Acidimicrobiales bacterium]|nr:3'(2'),5'-bisphosphate nucleotidase CysQ [Acidimicrobiales bacterium]
SPAQGHGGRTMVQRIESRENAATTPAEHDAAADLARGAGAMLLELRSQSQHGLRALSDEGDRRSHELLMDGLASQFPHDPVRSEEGSDSPGAERLWVIDPLDGSREYGEGREDWAVHVALAIGGRPAIGAIALPARGELFATADPPPLARAASVPRMVVSRSRSPAVAADVADRLGATTVFMGSAGAKIAAVIRGDAEIYVHAGGQYEWDSAAPVAVALSSGLHASRLDGSPLRYGLPDPWLPDLVVCHPSLAGRALAALADGIAS